MGLRSDTILITTDSSGDATSYSSRITGKLLNIHYIKDDFATGVDFAITVDDTAQGVWTQADQNATVTKAPLQLLNDNVGADDVDQADRLYLLNHRIKFVISNGGNAASGTFIVVYED